MSGLARAEGSESETMTATGEAKLPDGSADPTGAQPLGADAAGPADADDRAADAEADDPDDEGPDDLADEADETDETDETDEAAEPADPAEELFQQSEIAADYIEGLLDVLDLDGDIDELVSNGRPVVEVVGGGLQSLVGQRGATLEALQELARLAVFRQTGAPSRLLLDIGGYRGNRRNELAAVARNAVERVREHGEPVKLEPMSAFERKCVHDVINATEGVASESQGEEPSRRIVVRPE